MRASEVGLWWSEARLGEVRQDKYLLLSLIPSASPSPSSLPLRLYLSLYLRGMAVQNKQKHRPITSKSKSNTKTTQGSGQYWAASLTPPSGMTRKYAAKASQETREALTKLLSGHRGLEVILVVIAGKSRKMCG
ncbi:hypothetical protein E2C01_079886 [Portunus trituberculatus]|uniref:Uncharacterized protein n=1 Tax=Portunus trituberculatus TaxID=210409 RepID=A0A5B7IRQ0_PORTR|nr:hypothetical protein [Portunus trituberculatus]